jgi:hypothetical protein
MSLTSYRAAPPRVRVCEGVVIVGWNAFFLRAVYWSLRCEDLAATYSPTS